MKTIFFCIAADDYPSGSVRAVLVLRGLGSLLNNDIILLNSDLLIIAFLPPLKGATSNLTSFFDVTMNYKEVGLHKVGLSSEFRYVNKRQPKKACESTFLQNTGIADHGKQ